MSNNTSTKKQQHRFIKYPKFFLLLVSIVAAIFIFNQFNNTPAFLKLLSSQGYLSNFLAGFFYTYGFTAAPATSVLLLIAKEQNIFIAAFIGGIGALISDILIFYFVRLSFNDELDSLEHEPKMQKLTAFFKKHLHGIYKYLLPSLAGLIIASPLPSEVGVSLLATLRKLSILKFITFAYLLHTTGIFIILWLGSFL